MLDLIKAYREAFGIDSTAGFVFSVVAISVVVVGVAAGGVAWIVDRAYRNALAKETPRAEQATFERYKRFYENSPAPNKTTMIEFTNSELKKRATILYTGIKEMNQHYSEEARNRQARKERKEIDDAEFARLWQEWIAAAGKEFDEKYRVEARMVLLELRNRIPEAARKHIISFPSINPADKRAGQVSAFDILPPEFASGFSELLAREIEELTRLLPEKD